MARDTMYFGLKLDASLVQSALDNLMARSQIARHQGIYRASEESVAEMERRVAAADALETQVREQWMEGISDVFHIDLSAHRQQLWLTLRSYLGKSFQRHGIETVRLLSPDIQEGDILQTRLSTYLDRAVDEIPGALPKDQVVPCIKAFFMTLTPERTKYLAQLLDGTFTFFALTVDQATSAYLSHSISRLDLFLDTNFIFDLLGLHTQPSPDVSQLLVRTIRELKLPFHLYYHEETLDEIQRTIEGMAQRITQRKWQPSVSRALVRLGNLSGLELAYHQRNSDSPIDPDIFLSKYRGVVHLLADQGLKPFKPSPRHGANDTYERAELVARYGDFMKVHRPWHPKAYETLKHDIEVWWTVRSRRREGVSILDCGALLLSIDYYFYAFDSSLSTGRRQLGLVALPNQVLQLLRPLLPQDDQLDRCFVETFALPQFRMAHTAYEETIPTVAQYIDQYKDIPEETAVRILTDHVLLDGLKGVSPESETFFSTIENALVNLNSELLEEKEALRREKREIEDANQAAAVRAAEAGQKLIISEASRAAADERAEQAHKEKERAEEAARLERESQMGQYQRILSTLERSLTWRILALACLVFLFGAALIVLVPSALSWDWLENHPRKFGFYGASLMLWASIVWGVFDSKRRLATVIPVGAAVLIFLCSVIDY